MIIKPATLRRCTQLCNTSDTIVPILTKIWTCCQNFSKIRHISWKFVTQFSGCDNMADNFFENAPKTELQWLDRSGRVGADGRSDGQAITYLYGSQILLPNTQKRATVSCASWILSTPLSSWPLQASLTLRLLMSYIYGAPSKTRNADVVYIWTYVWQRWNSLFLFAAQCFNTESMQRGFLCHICV